MMFGTKSGGDSFNSSFKALASDIKEANMAIERMGSCGMKADKTQKSNSLLMKESLKSSAKSLSAIQQQVSERIKKKTTLSQEVIDIIREKKDSLDSFRSDDQNEETKVEQKRADISLFEEEKIGPNSTITYQISYEQMR